MKYKNGKFKLLNVTCALFILLLVSSAASAQKVEVSEKTPAQLINTANMIIENTDVTNMQFSSPKFNEYYETSPYLDAYASDFRECKEPFTNKSPLIVMLLANKMGAVSEIHIIYGEKLPDDYKSGEDFSSCIATLCASLGLTATETSNMFNDMRKSVTLGETKKGTPYAEGIGSIYSFSMKRRFVTNMRIYKDAVFIAISATD